MPLAVIKFLSRSGGDIDNSLPEGEGPVDPGYGQGHPINRPSLPIQLPPLPPGWVMPPIAGINPPVIGGGPVIPEWPVVIPQPPDKPEQGLPPTVGGGPVTPPGGIATPPIQLPGEVWPPLNPSSGIGGTGKYLVLIHIFGVGNRWLVYDATKPVPQPPVATPK